jgi:hypothetical protein
MSFSHFLGTTFVIVKASLLRAQAIAATLRFVLVIKQG